MRRKEYINEFDDDIHCYDGEEWRIITWASRHTEVSSFGRIRIRNALGEIVIRKLHFLETGRLCIDIYNQERVRKSVQIGRLVAEFFLPNPDPKNKIMISYKDFNAHNNRAENLEWLSQEEHKEKFKDKWKEYKVNVVYKSDKIKLDLTLARVIRKMSAQGIAHWEIAEAFGISSMQVTRVVRQENWKEPEEDTDKTQS